MHKDNVSGTLLALIAGATVGAGVGLLFSPQTGSQSRTPLREYKRKVPDVVDEPHISTAAAGCSMRSGPQDHTLGDTGHDN
jgi:gas vesicle protein